MLLLYDIILVMSLSTLLKLFYFKIYYNLHHIGKVCPWNGQ